MGDIVHALPMAAAIRTAFPQAFLGWAVDTRFAGILDGSPVVDRLFPVNLKQTRWYGPSGISTICKIVGSLRASRFQSAVDVQGLLKSGLISLASGASERIGFGWGEARERLNPLLNNRRVVSPGSIRHVVYRNLHLAEKGLGFEHKGDLEFPLGFDEEIDRRVAGKLDQEGLREFAVLSPGAGWRSKLWSVQGYVEVAKWILQKAGLGIFINYGPGEKGLADPILAALGRHRVACFPTTLSEYLHLIRKARFYVGSDSGPYHIAMATGTRAVGIFGPSDPGKCGPWDASNPVVWNRDECAPCYKRNCSYPKCMAQIEASAVIDALKGI